MRDIGLMGCTLRAIRDHGGMATRLRCGVERCAWFAGTMQLNAQAMHDLINDGWIQKSRADDHVFIDAWPSFADSLVAEGATHE